MEATRFDAHAADDADAAAPLLRQRHFVGRRHALSAAALVGAVRRHPWTNDGPGRADTIAIEQTGVFAKGGAEGVMIMVAPDGTTVALKMLDGSARASSIVALRLLARTGALSAADVSRAREELPLRVRGGERDVGMISPAF